MLFATASQWVTRLADTHHAGTLQTKLRRLGRYPLLVIDEVGYIPFEPEAANLFFQLIPACYERASLIVTSNKPFGRWGEVFGDDVVAAAMIDRLVHHGEVIALKGDSYRLRNRDLGRTPSAAPRTNRPPRGVRLHPSPGAPFSPAVDDHNGLAPYFRVNRSSCVDLERAAAGVLVQARTRRAID